MLRKRLLALAPAAALVATLVTGPPSPAAPRPSTGAPPPRAYAAMANDAAAGHVVLFGGWDGVSVFGDTWTWDGTAWTERHPAAAPSPRCCAQIAYDASEGEVVLFGGSDQAGVNFTDTWIWNGVTWTEQHPAHAPMDFVCCEGGMAFDAVTYRSVYFSFAQTWTWDGVDWTQESPIDTPSNRFWPGVARSGNHVILFGGDNGFEEFRHFQDTWGWNGRTWRRFQPRHRPAKRTKLGLAYDQTRRQTVLFGGEGELNETRYLNDTWTWNGVDWTRRSPATSPSPRDGMSMAFDSARQRIVMFGGRISDGQVFQYLGDTWTWDGTNWTPG